MSSNYLLLNKDYTIYNALAWGNCVTHARLVCAPAASWSQRIFHASIAFVELLPIISQIASLFEMAIANLFKPSTEPSGLTKRKIRRIKRRREPHLPRQVRVIKQREPLLPHQARAIAPLAPPSEVVDIELPIQIRDLDKALFSLHRQIDSQYRALPWPAKMKKIVVMTQVCGGRGDIVAAAKAIALMQKFCSTLTFDWVFLGACTDEYDPRSFLHCNDPSKVHIRHWESEPPEKAAGDLLLTGPVKHPWQINYIEGRIQRKIAGPAFGFLENAEDFLTFNYQGLQNKVKNASKQGTAANEIYQSLHSTIFPSTSGNSLGFLPMGLATGTGVFFDPDWKEVPLSRGYCSPSHLPKIQEARLRKDILEAMNVYDGISIPDYDQHSFNSGYAHRLASFGKFIDCVAIHEKNKHTVIVLNQRGAFVSLTTQEFKDQIFTSQRLAFLKQKGYGTVLFKGEEPEATLLQEAVDPQLERRLTVIVRSSFSPTDMSCMQFASERLLATGDNSAVESWRARCKLYLYEDVANMGCKERFLQQQVDLAKTISPTLSQLLALFGGDKRRLPDPSLNQPFNAEQMVEVEKLLNDPNLSDATLQFCDGITSSYSFDEVLEGALKRTAWHHCIPQLARIEAEALDESFRTGLVTYFRDRKAFEKALRVRNIPELGKRVEEAVQQWASSET